jgi:hypothetical protein
MSIIVGCSGVFVMLVVVGKKVKSLLLEGGFIVPVSPEGSNDV